MASLNLSTNGPSITKSYQSVINAPPASGTASNSPTYGQWAIFSVSTPLVSPFQQDSGGNEAVLKVQTTGGECFLCYFEIGTICGGSLVARSFKAISKCKHLVRVWRILQEH